MITPLDGLRYLFQITKNLSLDGVLDKLNSKNVSDAGPLDLINNDIDDDDVVSPVALPTSLALP